MAQSRTFDICSALDASNSETFAKRQPSGWVDAQCCERFEDLSCDGAGIANDDGMNGYRTPSCTEQGIPECSMLRKCLVPDATMEVKVRCMSSTMRTHECGPLIRQMSGYECCWSRGSTHAESVVSRSTPTRRLASDTLLASHVSVQSLCTPSSIASRMCKTASSCLR